MVVADQNVDAFFHFPKKGAKVTRKEKQNGKHQCPGGRNHSCFFDKLSLQLREKGTVTPAACR